jgi:hypothetical protein
VHVRLLMFVSCTCAKRWPAPGERPSRLARRLFVKQRVGFAAAGAGVAPTTAAHTSAAAAIAIALYMPPIVKGDRAPVVGLEATLATHP